MHVISQIETWAALNIKDFRNRYFFDWYSIIIIWVKIHNKNMWKCHILQYLYEAFGISSHIVCLGVNIERAAIELPFLIFLTLSEQKRPISVLILEYFVFYT